MSEATAVTSPSGWVTRVTPSSPGHWWLRRTHILQVLHHLLFMEGPPFGLIPTARAASRLDLLGIGQIRF